MMVAGSPPAPRHEPGSLRAIVLALAVHGAFFALIVFGVTWQSRAPLPVQAEIWDRIPVTKVDLPKELTRPIEKQPEPEKPIELKTPPRIDKRPEEVKPAPVKPDAQIAEKAAREKREKEKAEKQKAAEAKKKQEEEARRKAEAERQAAAEAAQRAEFMKYVDQIRAKIRGRANVPDTVRGNPEVHVAIRILPGGEVLDITVTKRSGNPAYDNAIERGIRSASPLPVPPPNSELFPRFRELNLIIKHER